MRSSLLIARLPAAARHGVPPAVSRSRSVSLGSLSGVSRTCLGSVSGANLGVRAQVCRVAQGADGVEVDVRGGGHGSGEPALGGTCLPSSLPAQRDCFQQLSLRQVEQLAPPESASEAASALHPRLCNTERLPAASLPTPDAAPEGRRRRRTPPPPPPPCAPPPGRPSRPRRCGARRQRESSAWQNQLYYIL